EESAHAATAGTNEFHYLVGKIDAAPFIDEPFRNVSIHDFLSTEHFARLIADLTRQGYEPQPFPGCITSVDDYIRSIHDANAFNRDLLKGYGQELLEG